MVLEAIALEAIEADVGQPHQTESKDERSVLPPANADRHGRHWCGVRGVIDEHPDPGAAEVSHPRQVRQQDESGDQPPRLTGGGEGHQGADYEN